MEQIVYPFRRTVVHYLSMAAGILGISGSLPFFCIWIPVGIGIVSGLRSGELLTFSKDALIGWIGMCSVSAIGPFLCLLSILVIILAFITQEAVLTSQAFTFGPRGRTKTLQLSEIVSVSVSYSWLPRMYAWIVTIKDSHQQQIQIPIALGWLTMRKVGENVFDYRTMFGDLLPRLPLTATVDQRVRNFVSTGEFS